MTNKFWYLTGHELKKRVKTKSFLVINIILFILIVVACNIPTIIQKVGGDFEEPAVVYVDSDIDSSYVSDSLLDESFMENYPTVTSVFKFEKIDNFDSEKVSTYLEESEYVINIESDGTSFKATIYTNTESLTEQVTLNGILTTIKQVKLFNDLTPEEQASFQDIQTPVVTSYITEIPGSEDSTSQILGGLSIFIIMPIFFFLIMIMAFVGTSIIEEKSSRAIEIIITNVKPIQHFFSKILSALFYVIIEAIIMGFGSLIGILVMFGLTGSTSVTGALLTTAGVEAGSSDALSSVIGSLADKLPSMIISMAIFILLGFTFYLILIALAAAMSNTQEDFQQFQSPLMILLVVGLYSGIFGLQFSGSSFVKVMAYIPFFSPMLAPSLLLTGDYGIVQILISAGILLVSDGVLLYFGLPMYKTALLSNSNAKFFKRIKRIFVGRNN